MTITINICTDERYCDVLLGDNIAFRHISHIEAEHLTIGDIIIATYSVKHAGCSVPM